MLVSDIMTPNPIKIRPESDYLAAIAIMRAGKFRHLPVVDNEGNVLGIVSGTDLRAVSSSGSYKQKAIQSDGVLVRVGEIMKRPVIVVSPEYPLEEAARMMIEHHIGCLPVISEEGLVGIITDTDIFRSFVKVLGGGSQSIRMTVQVNNTPGQFATLASAIAEVGGNILSIASYPLDDEPARIYLTLRVESITLEDLKTAVYKNPDAEIIYSWQYEES